MNLVKFAKLTLATLATYEIIRTNAPAHLPVGVAKAATVATAIAVSKLSEEYLDPIAAVGVLTVANKWLNVDAVTPWGDKLTARWNGARERWFKRKGTEPGVAAGPPRWADGKKVQFGGEGTTVPRF